MDEMVIDTSWLEGSPLPPNDPQQREAETEMLKELAANVGQYDYNYTDEANQDPTLQGAVDTEEHLGIMAQDLLKIPGLASCVNEQQDGNGNQTYTVDGGRVALAALGYIAALTKIVLDMRGIEYGNSSETNANTVSGEEGNTQIQQSGTTATEGEAGQQIGINPQGQPIEATDSSGNVYDAATAAIGGM